MRGRRSADGFTIPELIIVVIILGLLALIAIATFLGQRESAQESTAVSTLRNVQLHAETLRANSGGSGYVSSLGDYASVGRYTFVESNVGAPSANVVSVSVGPDGDWAAFATRGGERCLFIRLEVGSDRRFDHSAPATDSGSCRADQFETGDGDGW